MASLLGCPNELLTLISEYIQPPDIVNFALVCKRLRGAGDNALLTHQSLIRQYGRISNYETLAKRHYLPELLNRVIQDTRISFYIRHVSLRSMASFWGQERYHEGDYDPEKGFRRCDPSDLDIIINAFLEDGICSLKYHSIENLREGVEGEFASLLISRLSHLTTLDCHADTTRNQNSCFFSRLREMAQCPSPRLLTQLTTVVLTAEVDIPPEMVNFFMALPSMRTVHAGVLAEGLPESSFPAKSSNVQNLVLYSGLRVDSIMRIIACSRSLSELFISQCDRNFGSDTPLSISKFFIACRGFEDGNAGPQNGSATQRIFQSIFDHASGSLEKLTINCWVDGVVRLENLSQFSKLRYLAVPIGSFCQDWGHQTFSIRACITNPLPALEHLRLIDGGELDAEEGHLEGVLEELRSVVDAKDDLVPKLSRLDLRPPLSFFYQESEKLACLIDALRSVCDEKVVEYNVVYFEKNWRVAPPSRGLLSIDGIEPDQIP